MDVLITAYDKKVRGRERDQLRAVNKGAKPRVYKKSTRDDDRWDD